MGRRFSATSFMETIVSFRLSGAMYMHILKQEMYFSCFYERIFQKILPNLLASFTLERNLISWNQLDAELHQMIDHWQLYVAYTAFLYDCQVFPINSHYLLLHLAMESKIRQVFRVNRTKMLNLDAMELHLQFQEVLKLPSIGLQWDFRCLILYLFNTPFSYRWYPWIFNFFSEVHVRFYLWHVSWVL